jgi:hypothetical protein
MLVYTKSKSLLIMNSPTTHRQIIPFKNYAPIHHMTTIEKNFLLA